MALDAATLALTAAQLRAALADARIDKIYQPTRDEAVFLMRSRTAAHRLFISARSGSARVCLTGESYDNPPVPPTFCMLLRKHLGGGKLVDVRTPAGERIVFFDFLCRNEMGDEVINTLAAELMGRYCNLVLVSGRPSLQDPQTEPVKIIDALKRVDFEDSEVRQLLPGLAYTLPPLPHGGLFTRQRVAEALAGLEGEVPVQAYLRKTLGGVGPVVLREICFRALGGKDPLANQLTAADRQALAAALGEVKADFDRGGLPCLVRKADGLPAEFSFTRLTQYLPGCVLEEYPDFSTLLEAYYAQKDKLERIRQKSKQLRKNVHNLFERAQRKQAARLEELEKSGESEALRVAGELLTGNLHAFKRGDASVRLQNWYDGGELDIKLDVRLSPSQNAQKYFKDYKKRQTAAAMLDGLLKAGQHEINYLETVLYEIDAAPGEAALEEIRAELKSQGYLKYYKPKDKRSKPADFFRYQSSDGFLILAGRNNGQNEKLSLKTARGKDLWFHTKNAPGSHVVVISEGQDIPLPTQNEAAMLAVWHSSQKTSAQVPVDYTEVKHLRKTGDLPLGMVLYERYETAYVTPDPAVIASLEATAAALQKTGGR